MKANICEKHGLIRCVGYWFLIVLLLVCGCSTRPNVVTLTENDITCQVVVQTEWGNGPSELGYRASGVSSKGPDVPSRFQLDEDGNVYIADSYNNRVVEFAPNGQFIRSIEIPLSNGEGFVWDISVRNGLLAVAANERVYAFDSEGHLIQVVEPPAEGQRFGLCSTDMAGKKVQVDGEGNIYVCLPGGFERGGTVLQYNREGEWRVFYEGAFTHLITGWDGFIYIGQERYSETSDSPSDSQMLIFDSLGDQVGEVTIQGQNLAAAGLFYLGLPVAVDAEGNLYTNVVNILRNGEIVSQEALVQVGAGGEILRVIQHKQFQRPATDVVDKEGIFYLWHFGKVPSEPAEIWRCNP